MRLCPLRPRSTAQRELVNIFSKAKCLRGPRSEAATASTNETGVPSDFSPRGSDGRHRKTEEDFTVGRVSRARCCLLAPRAVVCLVSSVWSMLANYFGSWHLDAVQQSSDGASPFPFTPASASRRVPLPPPRLRLSTQRTSGRLRLTTLRALTQTAADSSLAPSEGRGGVCVCVKMLCSWKEPKIPEILQNLVFLLHRLWTEDVIIMVDAVTHSHMDSRGPRTWANACICCTIPLAGGGSSRSSWAPSSVKLKIFSCVIVTLLSSPEGLRHAPPPAVFTHAAQSESGGGSKQC